jgi:hypothetical protein
VPTDCCATISKEELDTFKGLRPPRLRSPAVPIWHANSGAEIARQTHARWAFGVGGAVFAPDDRRVLFWCPTSDRVVSATDSYSAVGVLQQDRPR